jgi:hypothetical protein
MRLSCDEVLKAFKLPFIYSNLTRTSVTESAENAFEALKNKYPDDKRIHNIPKSGMVAKTINNHCVRARLSSPSASPRAGFSAVFGYTVYDSTSTVAVCLLPTSPSMLYVLEDLATPP